MNREFTRANDLVPPLDKNVVRAETGNPIAVSALGLPPPSGKGIPVFRYNIELIGETALES